MTLSTVEKECRLRALIRAAGLDPDQDTGGRRVDAARAWDLLDELMAGYLTLDEVEAATAELGYLHAVGQQVLADTGA